MFLDVIPSMEGVCSSTLLALWFSDTPFEVLCLVSCSLSVHSFVPWHLAALTVEDVIQILKLEQSYSFVTMQCSTKCNRPPLSGPSS